MNIEWKYIRNEITLKTIGNEFTVEMLWKWTYNKNVLEMKLL